MNREPHRSPAPPGWRDPILWLPIVTITAAAILFGFSWRELNGARETPAATVAPTREPSDPAALARLWQMESAMNQLTTLRAIELLRDDSGNSYTTTLSYAAPDRVYLQLSTGAESIGIGPGQWARSPGERLWSHWERVEPFVFPDFHDYSNNAVDVQFGDRATVNGQAVQTITFAFVSPEGRFDFVVYADLDRLLFRRLTMDSPGHHMVTDYVDYAPRVVITPPPPDQIAPTPTVTIPH